MVHEDYLPVPVQILQANNEQQKQTIIDFTKLCKEQHLILQAIRDNWSNIFRNDLLHQKSIECFNQVKAITSINSNSPLWYKIYE